MLDSKLSTVCGNRIVLPRIALYFGGNRLPQKNKSNQIKSKSNNQIKSIKSKSIKLKSNQITSHQIKIKSNQKNKSIKSIKSIIKSNQNAIKPQKSTKAQNKSTLIFVAFSWRAFRPVHLLCSGICNTLILCTMVH